MSPRITDCACNDIAASITNKEMVSDNEMVVSVYQEGREREKKMRLMKIGNEWKYAGPPRQ